MINYTIGREYRYPDHNKRFKLMAVDGWTFIFECGHRVADSVFIDLIDCSTGIQVLENNQLNLL